MYKAVAALALTSVFNACCAAQTGTYTWQVSTDNGQSWSSGATVAAGSPIRVRLLAGWEGITGSHLGYAGGQFDAMVVGTSAVNSMTNILRPGLFAYTPQTLVASAYSQGIKVDSSGDIAEPGLGTGWINPGQLPYDLGPPENFFDPSNPAIIFQYDMIATATPMRCGMALNPNPAGRAFAVYINAPGSQVRLTPSSVIVHDAYINPTPGTLSPILFFALSARRNRTDKGTSK